MSSNNSKKILKLKKKSKTSLINRPINIHLNQNMLIFLMTTSLTLQMTIHLIKQWLVLKETKENLYRIHKLDFIALKETKEITNNKETILCSLVRKAGSNRLYHGSLQDRAKNNQQISNSSSIIKTNLKLDWLSQIIN
jgi:hypothetical protein